MQQDMPALTPSQIASDNDHVEAWLMKFEQALRVRDRAGLEALFTEDCHWRDHLAFTWNITPHVGRDATLDQLVKLQDRVRAANFEVAEGRTPPRRVRRAGVAVIEAIFSMETAEGRGHGVIRLLASEPGRAWVFMTSLEELKGFELPIDDLRPAGSAYSREFGGQNWADRRAREQEYADREPAVLIIGAGQAGLSTAARLRLLGVDTLCVDSLPRVGDNWRQRYHSLALHNRVTLNHLAHLPFPSHWPKFLSKDMLAGWLEKYAWVMECNVWTGTDFVEGSYDEAAGCWNARVRRPDGTERVLRPRHLVFANGIAGAPKKPELPGLDAFRGEVMHTHGFRDGSAWKGKNALVLGVGNSGHDVAQDLHSHGANVKLIQRGPVLVASVAAAALVHSVYYNEGLPLADADLVGTASTYPLMIRSGQLTTKRIAEMDAELLAGLRAKGFKIDFGEENAGHQVRVRHRHGGYYLNCGCSELIISGEVGLLHFEDIERFVPEGALMKDGRVEKADLLVTATGYENQQDVVRKLLGDGIADRVGPVWGLDAQGDLRNMFKPTPQKGLWFIGGGLAQARVYSHYIALQIKAREAGIVS